MVCLGRPYHFKFSRGYLPQILLRQFLNTLIQLQISKSTGIDNHARTYSEKKKKKKSVKDLLEKSYS